MVTILIILLVAFGLIFLVWACSTISSGVFVKAFCKVKDCSDKVVYLTFDDGPDPIMTPKILEILSRHNATATFFLIGFKTSGNEALILRMISEGHQVGNHSSSHSGTFPLYSKRRMMSEVRSCSSILESITGNRINLFRPPFGVTNPTVAKVVRSLDYNVVGWSIRTLDTKYPDPSFVLERVKDRLEPGAVILLHDRLPQSPEILETLLNYLEEQGYVFNRPLPA